MSLAEVLAAQGITSAIVVDDACDEVPTAADIGPTNEAWPNFSDDLSDETRALIEADFPAEGHAQDELIALDGYVATIWKLREQIGAPAARLFRLYVDDVRSDERYVRLVKEKLEAQGVNCTTAGREFAEQAKDVDLIVIDLFLGKAQNDQSITETKTRLRAALKHRAANPPLVLLMSRSSRIDEKRDEFRDEVGLLESAFRIVRKSELDAGDKFETQLQRLAENAPDSRKLARFFDALDHGLGKAAVRTLETLRRLRLSDIGQIQQLLLAAEGEAVGSYLVDIFDRILLHEIEADGGIIDAAISLNGFQAAKHPPPYAAGSPELQDLVQRTLTQHPNRIRLPGSEGARVTFGDVLKISAGQNRETVRRELLVDIADDEVLLVMTPACDLQRDGAPRVLLLVGKVKPLKVKDWIYANDARTSSIKINDQEQWIKWNVKHVDTVSPKQLETALDAGQLTIVARLREAHALELQQKLLSGLGRVGLVANMPATFAVQVEVYFAGVDGRAQPLQVPALADGATCFAGRDGESKPVLRLVMTEGCVDGIHDALSKLGEDQISEKARKPFMHVVKSQDLRQMLALGFDLTSTHENGWTQIPSISGKDDGVESMGLIAWNYEIPDQPIAPKQLARAGVILLVKDLAAEDAPGREEAIRSGLVDPTPPATDPEAE
jgi:CheY-like chemotaxis protein